MASPTPPPSPSAPDRLTDRTSAGGLPDSRRPLHQNVPRLQAQPGDVLNMGQPISVRHSLEAGVSAGPPDRSRAPDQPRPAPVRPPSCPGRRRRRRCRHATRGATSAPVRRPARRTAPPALRRRIGHREVDHRPPWISGEELVVVEASRRTRLRPRAERSPQLAPWHRNTSHELGRCQPRALIAATIWAVGPQLDLHRRGRSARAGGAVR